MNTIAGELEAAALHLRRAEELAVFYHRGEDAVAAIALVKRATFNLLRSLSLCTSDAALSDVRTGTDTEGGVLSVPAIPMKPK